MMDVKGVVYSIPCAECSAGYVGETWESTENPYGRTQEGSEEHGSQNGIAMHVHNTAHAVNWQEARILAGEDNWGRRRVCEALEIDQRRLMKNLDAGLTMDPLWTPFLCRSRSHVTRSAAVRCPTPI